VVAPLVALWVLGMERDRVGWSIGAGLVLGLTSFMTFNFLVIGFFMLGCALLASGRRISTSLIVTLKHSLIVLATFAAANLLLYLTSDYNPLRTFASALEHQRYILTLPTVARPYPRTVLFDLTDFALGSAWIGSLLAAYGWLLRCGLARRRGRRRSWCLEWRSCWSSR
jgi:hypothetical protein